MRRVLVAGSVMLALGSTSAARAQNIAEALCAEALKGTGVIDPIDLRSAALAKVDADTLDRDHNGIVTAEEMFDALTMESREFCSTEPTKEFAARAKSCGKDANAALHNAQNDLTYFWTARGSAYDIETIARPSDNEKPLARRDYAVLLAPGGGYARVVCRRPAKSVVQDGSAPKAAGGGGGSKVALLLGKDIDSLTVKRLSPGTPDRLKKVSVATISLSGDNVADTRTFAVDAVAGISLIDNDRYKLIPFFQYSRSEVRDRKAGTDKLTGKLAAGAVGSLIFGDDQIDLAPLYAKDLKNHSELFTARLAWRPGFLYSMTSFNRAWHFACKHDEKGVCELGSGLAIWTDFQMIGSFGTVLANGNDPDFIKGRGYARIGPSLNVHLYGLDGLARDFSLDAGYKRLFKLSGDTKPVYALKAGLNYWIAGSDHVSMTTGYEHSRDEETLEETDTWKVGLGIRF